MEGGGRKVEGGKRELRDENRKQITPRFPELRETNLTTRKWLRPLADITLMAWLSW